MSLFKYEKQRVLVDMDVLANLPQLLKMFEADVKNVGVEFAEAKLRLLFHLYDPRSPYFEMLQDKIEAKIVNAMLPELKEWVKTQSKDTVWMAARKLYSTFLGLVPEWSYIQSAAEGIHRMSLLVKAKSTDAERIPGLISKIRKANEDLTALRAAAREAQAEKTKGDHSIRKREDPEYQKESRSRRRETPPSS